MNTAVGSICLIANDLAYIVRNGGIGTYFWELAHVLARAGWRVHVLYCGPVEDPDALTQVPRRLANAGIGFSSLDTFTRPRCLDARAIFGEPNYLLRSERVRRALEELHGEHHFDLVEFAEWEATGFRTVQAQRAGLAFHDVRSIVKLHSPQQWLREGNLAWMATAEDLRRDYCERYAFEHASLQTSPSRYMLDYARSIHWNVHESARAFPNPFPARLLRRNGESPREAPEIVFFGRLEARKGIEVFVDAAKRLDPRIPLRFLGKDDAFEGAPASQWIANQLRGRDVSLITNLNWEQALAYLSQGNRLAVIPSLSDNLPYVVIECAVNGIAFVASKVGGIPEILPDAELQAKLLFEPNPRGLFDCLDRFLHTDEAERRALREKVQLVTDVSANHRRIAECYSQLLQPRPTSSSGLAPVMRDDPLVTVCVPFYNLGAYLPDTLASLAAQTYTKLEVVVINDGSTDAASLRIFDDQQRLYPQFRFVSQPNAGLGATRNSGIAEAKGEYFLPMDSDNIAAPHMVERFVGAMRCRPDVSALTSYFLAFRDTADLAQQKFHYAYRPAGGSYVMGSLENVYGDANAIYRLADLKAIGGYETELDTTCEDWELFVKLLNAGYRVDVLPDYLFYYRHRDDSLVRTTKHYRNRQRVLRQFFRLERLPDPDRMALWTALASLHARLTEAQCRQSGARYRIADELPDFLDGAPRLSRFFSELLRFGRQGCKRMASLWPGRG